MKGCSPHGQQEVFGLTSDDVQEEISRINDFLDVNIQNQFDLATIAKEQAGFDSKRGSIHCSLFMSKEDRFRRDQTVRNALKMKTHNIKREDIRVAIEFSPRRRAVPRAQARFLNTAEQVGGANSRYAV